MSNYIYKVIPAPAEGKRTKGAKGTAGRFAASLESTINELANEGWQFMRAESLPAIDRVGITRKRVESFQNVLVFRKPTEASDPVVDEATGPTRKSPFFKPRRKPEVAAAATAAVAAPALTMDDDDSPAEAAHDLVDEAVDTATDAVQERNEDFLRDD